MRPVVADQQLLSPHSHFKPCHFSMQLALLRLCSHYLNMVAGAVSQHALGGCDHAISPPSYRACSLPILCRISVATTAVRDARHDSSAMTLFRNSVLPNELTCIVHRASCIVGISKFPPCASGSSAVDQAVGRAASEHSKRAEAGFLARSALAPSSALRCRGESSRIRGRLGTMAMSIPSRLACCFVWRSEDLIPCGPLRACG